MTKRATMAAIRAAGLTARLTDGEWRITFPGLTPARAEAVAYYTTDRADAVATAQAMSREAGQQAIGQVRAIRALLASDDVNGADFVDAVGELLDGGQQ